MKRREFIKLSLAAGTAVYLPEFSYASSLDPNQINFSNATYTSNNAQTIIIFLYGGASQLAGNLSNYDTIKTLSQNNYDSYFGKVTKTANNFWRDAGGDAMEELIANGDMTVFRSCYSAAREAAGNKTHGLCTLQNQLGSYDTSAGGILSNLAHILDANHAINENTLMPFVTMEGESKFYTQNSIPAPSYLKPVSINENLDNPYKREEGLRRWYYYTDSEREIAPNSYNKSDDAGGFDPAITNTMDQIAQQHNHPGKIKDSFTKRKSMEKFITSISTATTPDLGSDAYPDNNKFSKKLETAVKLLVHNPDTKVLTLGTSGLGGWDDHNEARNYIGRMHNLFTSLKSAMAHLRAEGKEQNINIMVFGEFGRNVNLNNAKGWDHGNLQNLYVLGGKGYFNHKGVVGETMVVKTGVVNRLYLHPKEGTYWFEPLSIAATLYKLYGIGNPKLLTGGYGIIDPLFT